MANPEITEEEVAAIYDAAQHVFFEGPWEGSQDLEDALMEWAEEAHVDHLEHAGRNAAGLEEIIREEEGAEAIAEFINGLRLDLRLEALHALKKTAAELEEEHLVQALEGKIHALEL